jgi:hypothetical protein
VKNKKERRRKLPMTAQLPMPSSQVANKAGGPRMRVLYPLGAVCLAALFLMPSSSSAQTTARLRPNQERAIELVLTDVEPAMRPMARQQLAASFANFNEAQIAIMLAKMNDARPAQAKAPTPIANVETVATPAALAYNRAQYEPVIRKHHAAQTAFDAFANAKLAAYCPGRDAFARFGSGWRYEQGQFMQPFAYATWNVETNAEVASQAYAPQDGRYEFDFSKVRMRFDEKTVDAAIRTACENVRIAGKAFLAKVDALIAAKDWDGAFKAEGVAQAQLSPIREELEAEFRKISPGDFTEIQLALMSGRKVK